MRPGLALLALLLSGCSSLDRLADLPEPLVDFGKLHPAAVLDIRYAGPGNITGRALYPVAKCALRQSVARRLDAAARELEARGLRVKLFDCYRPRPVQEKLWAVKPDERYVASPIKGSRHNRGAAVDLTLADAGGEELVMPSPFDDFSPRAHRDSPASPRARANMLLLEQAMKKHGFIGLPTEWWHFDAEGWQKHPLADTPLETIP